jgi:hypothetical protein
MAGPLMIRIATRDTTAAADRKPFALGLRMANASEAFIVTIRKPTP